MTQAPMIIPVASGKGGVGKTWFTAGLAMGLAELGADVIAVDLDLGGSNLHLFLGMPNRYPGIGDYLVKKHKNLNALAVPSPWPNLRLIPGDGQSLFMGNIAYAQKTKLLKAIRGLQTDFVLLDLGAGSAFNTLDFFAMSPLGLLLTSPEMPAMINLMTFVKNRVFRLVEQKVRDKHQLHKRIKAHFAQSIEDNPISTTELLQEMAVEYPEYAAKIGKLLSQVRLRPVINMGNSLDDLSYLRKIEQNLSDRLGIAFDHFGFIPRDVGVMQAAATGKVYLKSNAADPPARAVRAVADRVLRLWSQPIPQSWERLYANTQRSFLPKDG